MTTAFRKCKVCGVEYPYCKSATMNNIFRWQDVACCQEHGAEYFRLVAIARGEIPTDEASVEPVRSKESLVEDVDNYDIAADIDDEEEDDFDDYDIDDDDEEDIDVQ